MKIIVWNINILLQMFSYIQLLLEVYKYGLHYPNNKFY